MSHQQAIAAALLDPAHPCPPGLTAWNGSDPARRFAVYRNNVIVSLIDALADTFAVTQELVGEAFFRAMAREFAYANPPTSPLLAFYGDTLPDYIEHFPPAASVPYLADVARLDADETTRAIGTPYLGGWIAGQGGHVNPWALARGLARAVVEAVGGGKVGMYLAQSLLAHRHKVTIIEPQEMLCRSLADSLDIPVICGDAISFDTMRTADVASCDAFVAVTGADENNLVACQIAKREFGVNRTVARASNPKNRELLHTLGVDTVVCGTDNLSHILEREIETDTIRQLLSLGGGTASLNEILLPENFKFAGQAVKDIPMPGDVILVCITRDAEFIIPHGNTTLLPWDRILCLTQDDTLHLLMDAWGLSGK